MDPTILAASGMGLSNLQHEPRRLNSEGEKCNAELESLVMENYRVFVENLTCSEQLRSEDTNLSSTANNLSQNLVELTGQCMAFRDRVSHFVTSHKRNRKTLQHHMQLVDLLEVPQLVDACARNGFHDESLELANFVNGLERRHLLAAEVRPLTMKEGHRMGSDVIQSIVDDVHTTLLGLRQQLLALLSQQSSLSKELQILATLRKLDGLLIDRQLALERHANATLAQMSDKQRDALRSHFLQCSETRLQMEFLEARSAWLCRMQENVSQGLTSSLSLDGDLALSREQSEKSDDAMEQIERSKVARLSPGGAGLGPYGKAIEMLEANRTSWFAVVTQFNALFEDSMGEAEEWKDSASCHPASTILQAWIATRIASLLIDLEKLASGIEEGAAVRSVLEQALFFASRMGQVGCDFSGSVLPIFRQVTLKRVAGDWKIAMVNFTSMLKTERFTVEAGSLEDVQREQWVPLYLSQDRASALEEAEKGLVSPAVSKRGSDDVPAPLSIMTFPPLAYLLNAVLGGMNFLRECPMISAKDDLASELRSALVGLVELIIASAPEIKKKGTRYLAPSSASSSTQKGTTAGSKSDLAIGLLTQSSSEPCLDKMYANAVACIVLPHLLSCFDHVFSSGTVKTSEKGRRGGAVALSISSLGEAGDLSREGMAVLEKCWKALDAAGLMDGNVVA